MITLAQSEILQALGFAIGHSLWQMAFLWLVFHFATHAGKWSSHHKYALSVSAALAGFVWFVLTFIYFVANPPAIYNPGPANGWVSISQLQSVPEGLIFVYHSILSTLRSMAPYFSCAYLVVMFILSLRLVNGFKEVKALRTSGLSKPNLDLRLFVRDYAELLGIPRKVEVFISELAPGPLTIGFLKPIILIPMACLNQLTPHQMEAILLHELSHIRRHDYLLNILLQIAEITMFFNPFMRILLRRMRVERENSCDDWVLQFRYNAKEYASALLMLEQSSDQSLLALGANHKNQYMLLNRIKRMVAPERHAFNYRQQLGLVFIITMLGLGFTVMVPKPGMRNAATAQNIDKTPKSNPLILPLSLKTGTRVSPPSINLVESIARLQSGVQGITFQDLAAFATDDERPAALEQTGLETPLAQYSEKTLDAIAEKALSTVNNGQLYLANNTSVEQALLKYQEAIPDFSELNFGEHWDSRIKSALLNAEAGLQQQWHLQRNERSLNQAKQRDERTALQDYQASLEKLKMATNDWPDRVLALQNYTAALQKATEANRSLAEKNKTALEGRLKEQWKLNANGNTHLNAIVNDAIAITGVTADTDRKALETDLKKQFAEKLAEYYIVSVPKSANYSYNLPSEEDEMLKAKANREAAAAQRAMVWSTAAAAPEDADQEFPGAVIEEEDDFKITTIAPVPAGTVVTRKSDVRIRSVSPAELEKELIELGRQLEELLHIQVLESKPNTGILANPGSSNRKTIAGSGVGKLKLKSRVIQL